MRRRHTRGLGLILAILAMSGASAVEAASAAGWTNMTFSSAHGTQVEYLGARGDAHLWYPGNAGLVTGRWKRLPSRAGSLDTICFDYQANSYNPVTGTSGGQWECEPLVLYESHVVDVARGDAFKLGRSTQVPFDLPRERTTLSALRQR